MLKVKRRGKSAIPVERTKHPIKGTPICGALKKLSKGKLEEAGLTEEDLLKDTALFLEHVCTRPPLLNEGHGNGRCKFHGAFAGRKGKYATIFADLDEDSLETVSKSDRHDSLKEEMDILSLFVKQDLSIALGQQSGLRTAELASLLKQLRTAFMDVDFQKMKDLLDQLDEEFASDKAQRNARDRVSKTLQEYKELANVEYKRRALSGEYIPKKTVIHQFGLTLQVVANRILSFDLKTVSHETLIHAIRQDVIRFFSVGNQQSLESVQLDQESQRFTNELGSAVGLEDSDEEEGIITIHAE